MPEIKMSKFGKMVHLEERGRERERERERDRDRERGEKRKKHLLAKLKSR